MKLTKVKRDDYKIYSQQIVFSDQTILNQPDGGFTSKSKVYQVSIGYVVITKVSKTICFIDHFDENGTVTNKLDCRVCLEAEETTVSV